MSAVISVSLMADQASGSRRPSRYAPKPLRSASANTAASGSTRNSSMKISAMVINV
ncbi:hypothetical protein D3C72_2529900 [compost metagenome]